MSYSQNNEEEVLIGLFGTEFAGKFLDIGAYDGKTFSNTLRLVELGWTGVCVEPSPYAFRGLLDLHKERLDKVQLVNAALTPDPSPRIIPFYDSGGDAISTTSPQHCRTWEQGYNAKFSQFFLQTLPLVYLFNEFGTEWDFINIDVESTNLAIVSALAATAVRPRVLCVEYDGQAERVIEILNRATHTKRPYVERARNGENIILDNA